MADVGLTPAHMRLFFDEDVAFGFVDAAGGVELAVGPEEDSPVLRGAGESGALADQAPAQTCTSGGWIDQEQTELGGIGVFAIFHEEDAAQAVRAIFGDPAALAGRVVVIDEIGCYAGDQGFEGFVPAVFGGVDFAVPLDDPADVSGAMVTEGVHEGRGKIHHRA